MFDQPLEQWLTGRKKIGGGKYGNSNILRMKKNFLDEINNISYSCKGLTIGEK